MYNIRVFTATSIDKNSLTRCIHSNSQKNANETIASTANIVICMIDAPDVESSPAGVETFVLVDDERHLP